MRKDFNENKLFTSAQHVYRQGRSIYTAWVHMIDECLTPVDESKSVGAVLLDLTAAFYVIDQCIFLKNKYYGFCQTALKWTTTYVFIRVQQVFFNGSLSNIKMTSSTHPQGSCMGLLVFFFIFINDFPLSVKKVNVRWWCHFIFFFNNNNTTLQGWEAPRRWS